MNSIDIFPKTDKSLVILCLGAHSDDIEIGCGGTLLRLLSEYQQVKVHWIVFSGNGIRYNEAIQSANQFLSHCDQKNIVVQNFKDGFFPYQGKAIKHYFEQIKLDVHPDIIFTHYRQDLHQDHRTIAEFTWNTFRNHLILEYEIMKYDGDLGKPNFFVQLDETICQQKVNYLREAFQSQAKHHWFSQDAFFALLRLRGIECNANSHYAEAFYSRKMVF